MKLTEHSTAYTKPIVKIIRYVIITVIYIVLVFLAIATIRFGYLWYISDTSWEALFTIISGVFIPILLYLKKIFLNKIEAIDKNKIELEIKRKNIRCYCVDIDYAIQIDIEIYAYEKTSIRKLELKCKEPIGWSSQTRDLSDLPKCEGINADVLENSLKDLAKIIEDCEKINGFPIVIEKSEYLIFSIIGYVPGESLPDGYEGLSLNDWQITVVFGDKKEIVKTFSMDPHKKTERIPTEFKNAGFH